MHSCCYRDPSGDGCTALYAFLRHTDDLGDQVASISWKTEAINAWRLDFEASVAGGDCDWPGLPALADTVARYRIPVELLHEVIEGVSMDVEPRTFATFADLAQYCYRVASVVGMCCLHIWGYRSERGRAEKLAEKCGIALQLTNIIRDVHCDASNGRIYLPTDELERFGVGAADLTATGPPSAKLRALLAFQAQRAFQYYDDAGQLVPLVASVGRPVLLTIIGTYRALLDEIVSCGYNVSDGRISVSGWRKAAIVMQALVGRFASGEATRVSAGNAHESPGQTSRY